MADVRRRQATLFLRGNSDIDSIRRQFNPKQAELIDSHVTLIREDEVSDWRAFRNRIAKLELRPVTMKFGRPERDGDLVLIRAVDPEAFDRLRAQLLDAPRKHGAHITLVHPRNGVCKDADFEVISSRIRPFEHTFSELALIEQTDGGAWEIFGRFPLRDR